MQKMLNDKQDSQEIVSLAKQFEEKVRPVIENNKQETSSEDIKHKD